ncbi:MAG: hypothetical protein HY289_12005 [Planctomycetes bacterium]|nr:hypothetical protein [Planctomycetota bacterium]
MAFLLTVLERIDAGAVIEAQCLQHEVGQRVDRFFGLDMDGRFDAVQKAIANRERPRFERRELPPPPGQRSAAGKDQGRSAIHERLHTVPGTSGRSSIIKQAAGKTSAEKKSEPEA